MADHSFYVVAYALGLADLLEWQGDRGNLALLALYHDFKEITTGDIPTPTKRHSGYQDAWAAGRIASLKTPWKVEGTGLEKAALNEAHVIIKLADLFDAYFFLDEEIEMGNKEVRDVVVHIRDRLIAFLDGPFGDVFGRPAVGKVNGLFMAMCADRGRPDTLVE